MVGPVGGGLAALQQPGRGQDQRPGADRADHRRRVRGLAQVVADHLVAHGLDGRRVPAGDDHDRRVGHVTEGLIGRTVSGLSVAMGSSRSATTTGRYWSLNRRRLARPAADRLGRAA